MDSATSSTGYTTDSNKGDRPDCSPGRASTEDQLLEALKQFIVPFVADAMDQRGKTDGIEGLSGIASTKLITALKGFVLDILSDSSSASEERTITVNLDMENCKPKSVEDLSNSGNELPVEDLFSNNKDDGTASSQVAIIKQESIPREPAPTFQEKLLAGLREHIFNRMPIRLLHFIDQGSCLKISLLERGEVYAHLSSVIREDMPQNYREESDSEAIDQLVHKYSRYAILSHTWLRESPGEVTYSDWQRGTLNMTTLGYQKLVNFCKTAWREHRITLGWMDTVCINKESSSELDESIRSMFDWYSRAHICIIYLNDTQILPDIHRDTWFTRGWTLQELLAPRWIKFSNRNWEYFVPDASANDKSQTGEIMSQIKKATSISYIELIFGVDDIPLSRRMQMAASRQVTREEDTAYSLMGIFNVSIATAYGEGATRAFSRLLVAILESTSEGVLDLLNWADNLPWTAKLTNTTLLPPSPKYYIHRANEIPRSDLFLSPFKPLIMTPRGLHFSAVLMPGIFGDDQDEGVGHYSGTAHITLQRGHESFCTTFQVLGKQSFFDTPLNKWEVRSKYTLAVFNIPQSRQGIIIPRTCWAKLLEYRPINTSDLLHYIEESYSVVQTLKPIVFTLESKQGDAWYGYHIAGGEEDISAELLTHGMRLTSMYL